MGAELKSSPLLPSSLLLVDIKNGIEDWGVCRLVRLRFAIGLWWSSKVSMVEREREEGEEEEERERWGCWGGDRHIFMGSRRERGFRKYGSNDSLEQSKLWTFLKDLVGSVYI